MFSVLTASCCFLMLLFVGSFTREEKEERDEREESEERRDPSQLCCLAQRLLRSASVPLARGSNPGAGNFREIIAGNCKAPRQFPPVVGGAGTFGVPPWGAGSSGKKNNKGRNSHPYCCFLTH